MLEHLSWAVALMLLVGAQDVVFTKSSIVARAFVLGASLLALFHFFLAFATLL